MQTSITNEFLASGIAGEFSRSTNCDSNGAILMSATEASNVAGRVVLTKTGNDYEVGVNANGSFAGILATPKSGIRQSLAEQLYISNATQVEVATRGYMWVAVAAAAAVGDFVYYTKATGVISTKSPTTAPAATEIRVPGAKVVGKNVSAAGLCEIYFDIAGSTEKPTA